MRWGEESLSAHRWVLHMHQSRRVSWVPNLSRPSDVSGTAKVTQRPLSSALLRARRGPSVQTPGIVKGVPPAVVLYS